MDQFMDQVEALLARHPRILLIGDKIFRIVVILAVIFVSAKLIHLISLKITQLFKQTKISDLRGSHEREKRLQTVVNLVDTSLRIVLYGAGVMMILRECGLDITPLLTGAGIAGVAVGFGAQSLVKDVISGLFLLIEDQIRVGDLIRINAALSGVVERMELRMTAIRDADGTLHIVPNGEIKSVSNTTYEFGIAVVEIPVPFKVDLEKLFPSLEKTVNAINSAPEIRSKLKAKAEVVGITGFTDAGVIVQITAKTEAHSRADVAKAIRKQLLMELQLANIPLLERFSVKSL